MCVHASTSHDMGTLFYLATVPRQFSSILGKITQLRFPVMNLFDIILSERCDYNHSHRVTFARDLIKLQIIDVHELFCMFQR